MKIKYPDFSLAQMRALILKGSSKLLSDLDTSLLEVDSAINDGRFVLCWDDSAPTDAVPTIGALVGVARGRHGLTEFRVHLESGYVATYKNAKMIDTEALPMVVSGGSGPHVVSTTGYYVGQFTAPNGEEFCTVLTSVFDSADKFYIKPENMAFLSDVKFGITEGENG